MQNRRLPKNLIAIRIVATTLILLSLILPYFDLMAQSTTPFAVLATLLGFYVVESRYGKKTASE